MELHFEKLVGFSSLYLTGITVTLQFTAGSWILGFLLGFLIALIKVSKLKILKLIMQFYTSIFRGTPQLVQLFIIYYATPQLTGFQISAFQAAVGMMDGILSLIPAAKVGHIGLFRDPETLQPVEYYCKMPVDISEREVMILEPVLATGGSTSAAVQIIKNYGCRSIKLINIIAAPEGVEAVRTAHPDVELYCAAVDEKLDERGYIIPGIGDAGDRMFGTK